MKILRFHFTGLALVMLILGLGLGGVYFVLDLEGFLKGMCAGAAGVLIIGSVYIGVRYVWPGRGLNGFERATWLPSRDQAERS